MSIELVIRMTQELFLVALWLRLPALVVSLVVGLVVSIFQTVTSIQDQTLSYVPRIVLVGLAIVVTLGVSVSAGHRVHAAYDRVRGGGRIMTPELAVYAGLLLARLGAFAERDAAVRFAHATIVRVSGLSIALAAFYLSTTPPELGQRREARR